MLSGREIRIVIIDDDEDDYFIISDYIRSIETNKFIIDWCNDYKSALEKIRVQAYDLYFVDYRLGNKTGLELLQETSHIQTDAPIVVLTGKGNKAIDIAAMQSGATDYLVKSELNAEKLERCIRYALERTDTLRELKASENKYRDLFAGSKDAVFITNKNLLFIEVNYAASLLFGDQADSLAGRSLYHFIRDVQQKEQVDKLLKQKKNVVDLQVDICGGDEEIKPCLLSLSFSQISDHPFVYGILHDITNIKKTEEANLQAQKLAANERLMRVLAHEIRNPLNNIGLSIDNIQLPENASDKQKGLVTIIQRNCVRINNIITELLNLAKPVELVFEKHLLQDILDESIAAAADRINLQKIKVQKKYPEQPLEISADRSKLKIAFTNILINAIEAMEINKGQLKILMTESPENYIVSIQDNGHGIPEQYLSKLFEPFFTLKQNGMGLGLSASYSIIQSHKANLQVVSKVNEGTNFIICFNKG